MAFTLDEVVLWGRSFHEYVAMFALTSSDLKQRILGCGDGPASFNSILTKRGGNVVSVDPIYRFSKDAIKSRIDASYMEVLEQARQNQHDFVWQNIPSVEALGRIRMAAMEEFLGDYPAGLQEGRYIEGNLPIMQFKDREFGIALCSHLLFLYSSHFSEDFHMQSVKELCRVAEECRIFPLLELGARPSRHLHPVVSRLKDAGFSVKIEKVDYEFQKGGNQLLKVSAPEERFLTTR
jgi:hypothetical protein